MKAIAYDTYGNAASTAPILVTIPEGLITPDTTAPTVTISSPTAGQKVRKTASIRVTATDDKAVIGMEVMLDGNVIATPTNGYYSANRSLSRGSHTLVVTARDAAGNIGQSSVNFTK